MEDYKKLYNIQDKILENFRHHFSGFYVTGGTALGRFYLNHRFSDDLDFFIHKSSDFKEKVNSLIDRISPHFNMDQKNVLFTDDYVRIMLNTQPALKLEFVNDTAYHWGETIMVNDIALDNPANILANKLTALISRDEPKDVFDIVSISNAYFFNWEQVYSESFKKQKMNETDVAMRLDSFPADLVQSQTWTSGPFDVASFEQQLQIICNDFLLARDNSLGAGKTSLTNARPVTSG